MVRIWSGHRSRDESSGAAGGVNGRFRKSAKLALVGLAALPAVATTPSAPAATLASKPDTVKRGDTLDTTGSAARRTFTAFVTGYTWFDNTPPGSAEISHPVLHRKAGGIGTYADPITVAVGHDLSSGRDVLDYPAGTRFYMPYLKRYFIVEDTCGDGPRPQHGACHKHPSGVEAWLDIWVGGKGGTASSADSCARRITGNHRVQINPPNDRPVTAGPVSADGKCAM
jgi:hypothetical protein